MAGQDRPDDPLGVAIGLADQVVRGAFSSTTSSRVRHDIAVRAPSRAASPAIDNSSS
jgi:hypothetical protein